MPITGTFVADFSSFTNAVAKAQYSLKGLEDNAGKVEKSLKKIADSLSGNKLIQDANLMTQAVADLGGASRLTAKEQEKVNAVVTEAIEKYKALGQTAPKAMLDLAEATKKVPPQLSLMEKTFGNLAGVAKTFAATLTVGAITSAVKGFVDLTGSLTDMSAKTGISTTELQKLKYAAELSGGSLETVTGAIGKMSKALVEGDTGAVAAMKRLGLNINEVRQMEPGAAFSTIADAIAKIPSPMERSTLAMQLFGKSGAELLPMITGNMREAMEAAERLGIVLDEATVAAGDNLGDTFTTLTAVGQGVIGKVLAPMLPALQYVADAMLGVGNVVTTLQGAFQTLLKWGVQSLKFFADAAVKVGEFATKIPILGANMHATDKAVLESAKQWSTWLDDMAKGFDVVVPKAVKGTKTLGDAMTRVGLETKASAAAQKAASAELAKSAEAVAKGYEETVKAFQAYERANITVQQETIRTGLEVTKFGKIITVNQDTLLTWQRTMAAGIPVIRGLGSELSKIGDVVAIDRTFLNQLEELERKEKEAAAKAKEFAATLKGLGTALAGLSQVSGGGFGKIAQDLATLVSALAVTQESVDGFKKGLDALGDAKTARETVGAFTAMGASALSMASAFMQATESGSTLEKTLKGAALGAQIGSQFGAIGTAIGAGIGGIAGLIRGLFGKNQGRQMVEEFAKGLGGFDAIRSKLSAFGADGERLWKQLTQGSNSPAKAKAAIEAVNKALGDMPKRLNEIVGAAAKAGGGLDAAMLPYIEDLIRAGELTEENKNLLLGLPAAGVPSFDEVSAAAEALGVNVDLIGESIKNLKFEDSAAAMAANLDILARAGADMDAVLNSVRGDIQKMVTEALEFGRTLPESMRPFIQQLADSGKLTDQFGNQLTDLEELDFAKPLEESVDDLIVAMHELVDVIRNDVGSALDDLGRKTIRPTVAPRVEMPELPDGAGETAPQFAGGTHGQFLDFGSGTPAILHGRERIETEAEARGGGSSTIVVQSILDGRVIAESIAKPLTEVVRRYGLVKT